MTKRHPKTIKTLTSILDAARNIFVKKGYAATRMEDIAVQANIAKGTVYRYFSSKEALFEEVIRSTMRSHLEKVHAKLQTESSDAYTLLTTVLPELSYELQASQAHDVIKLLIAEGLRFPALVEFYYNEFICHLMERFSAIIRNASQQGLVRSDKLQQFPQLIAAPFVFHLIWQALFGTLHPMPIKDMLHIYYEGLFIPPDITTSPS